MEKKLISLVFKGNISETLVQNLARDLKLVFGDFIDIEDIYLDRLPEGQIIQGDAVLVTHSAMIGRLDGRVADLKKVIVITRTVTEEMIYRLYDIPKGTTVLVVNDIKETTEDTISMLYQLGIRHLKMVAYLPGETDITGIQIAITPGEAYRVPREITNIIDLGDRRLDMQTFLDLFSLFNVSSDHVKQALIRYSDMTLEIHTGVKTRYIRNYMMSESLKQILNLQNKGIIVTNEAFQIDYWNSEAAHILKKELKEEMALASFLKPEIANELTAENFSGDLFSINRRQYMISRTPLMAMGRRTGFCLTFESVEKIRESGNELSRKLMRQGLFARYTFEDIISRSPAMEHSVSLAKKAAASDYTILITGESGTGKELFAQSIHNASPRRKKPFVAVNCAALPENLLESELFGYEEGAFTGARRGGKIGLFEQADGGTIFLDEIGDMPYPLQAKLLRVLQEQQITRLGGDSVVNIDVRILTATNADLKKMIREKKFREDLFYRLNVLPLSIAPLRKRREDIVLLFTSIIGKDESELPEEIRQKLETYSWPGNVRELRNAAEYYTLMGNLECLEPESDEAAVLPVTAGDDIKSQIMRIIKRRANEGRNTGRGSLKEELKNQGIDIGETRLERLLAEMGKEGIITRKKGPGGIRLVK